MSFVTKEYDYRVLRYDFCQKSVTKLVIFIFQELLKSNVLEIRNGTLNLCTEANCTFKSAVDFVHVLVP